jgi:hypothetical protein
MVKKELKNSPPFQDLTGYETRPCLKVSARKAGRMAFDPACHSSDSKVAADSRKFLTSLPLLTIVKTGV